MLGLDYVRTARAKGLGERAVVLRHAARNALLPVVTVIGLQLGALLSGAVLTETVFNLAGVGRTLFEAITGRDYVVIQGFTLLIAVDLRDRQPARRRLVRLPRPADPTADERAACRRRRPDPLVVDPVAATRPASLWRDTLGSILRQRSAVVGLIILGFLVLVGDLRRRSSRPHDPERSPARRRGRASTQRAAPCIHLLGCPADQPQHIFGTDGNFRDVFSRVVFGARDVAARSASRRSASRSSSGR